MLIKRRMAEAEKGSTRSSVWQCVHEYLWASIRPTVEFYLENAWDEIAKVRARDIW